MAAKGSAAMSWRPPLGFRAVVEAIAEHAAPEEGEAVLSTASHQCLAYEAMRQTALTDTILMRI